MLKNILDFFNQQMLPADLPQQEIDIPLACAALLVEVMVQDGISQPAEKDKVSQILQTQFMLDEDEAKKLIHLAVEELDNSSDYFQFTQLITRYYNPQQRQQLVQRLWEIAYADNELDALEEHTIRKISGLLHVPHLDFIKARVDAEKKL